jgi:modulator of FtsH protease
MDIWHDFYATAGGASAALVGLLFVGVSMHLDAVVTRLDVRATARGAFQSLIAVLIVSLVALVPQIDGQSLGWTLVGLGSAGIVGASGAARRMFGSDLLLGARRAVQKMGLRFAGLALLIFVGVLFLTRNGGAQLWLMTAVFVLLGSSAQTAWSLLIEVAEAKKNEEQARSDAPEGLAEAVGR